MSGGYAHGKKAWVICGRCGQRLLLADSVFDGYYPSLRVHEQCYESRHPLDRLVTVTDPVALWRPNPEAYPITPPTLSGVAMSGLNRLTWTAVVSAHVRLNRYRVMRASGATQPELSTFTQVTALEIVYDYDGAILTQPLTYDNTGVVAGTTYWYSIIADDDADANRPFSAQSNVISLVAIP